MFRPKRGFAVLCAAVLSSGCGLGGSWKTTDVRPKGAAFPINQVTFDAQGKYTATGEFTAKGDYNGNTHTTTGVYTRRWQTLTLSPVGGPMLEYKTRRRWDGKLVMTLKLPGQDREATAVLSPATP